MMAGDSSRGRRAHGDEESKVIAAREAYYKAFGTIGPYPMEVSDRDLTRELLAAVKAGKPIPPDFDWYPNLPPGAVV